MTFMDVKRGNPKETTVLVRVDPYPVRRDPFPIIGDPRQQSFLQILNHLLIVSKEGEDYPVETLFKTRQKRGPWVSALNK